MSVTASGPAFGQAIEDDGVLRTAIISTVVAHDLGIPIGLLPFPITQLGGEAIQYSTNIALKAYRPYLVDPTDAAVRPRTFNVGFRASDDNDADACSYYFYLPNSTGTYENSFGLIPIRSPYYDASNNTSYPWLERWGALPPPRIWHGNSSARLSVRSMRPVRRWDAATGDWKIFNPGMPEETEYYWPVVDAFSPSAGGVPRKLGRRQPAQIDRDGQPGDDDSQEVYLPVGEHEFEWTATTQLNLLGDIVVPGATLAFGVLTEIKNAKTGVKVAGKVKNAGGISDDIADQADNAADVVDANKAKSKFRAIWERLLTQDPEGPLSGPIKAALCKQLTDVLIDQLNRLPGFGVTVLEAETGALLESAGQIPPWSRKLLDILFQVAVEESLATGVNALKDKIAEDGCGAPAGPKKPLWFKWTLRALKIGYLQQFFTVDTAVSTLRQRITIYDDVPPVWTSQPPPLRLEALDIGGIRQARALEEMRDSVSPYVIENCGRTPEFLVNAPELLPLGQSAVTWEARDRGPNPPGDDPGLYRPSMQQTIIVEDTSPPLLLAPPSRVFEADTDTPRADLDIGNGVATDIADPNPTIDNDLPDDFVFPLNSRTEITWTASDDSGNPSLPKSQLITVKPTGTNTAPVANAAFGSGITGAQIPITLTGTDADEIDGRFDPMNFKIVQQPENGGFIAPLLPFFIEDYRTGPEDGLPGYDPASGQSVLNFVIENYCDPENATGDEYGNPPHEFVHNAVFVNVTDDGIRYVLDEGFECSGTSTVDGQTYRRISRWDSRGGFIGDFAVGAEENPVGDAFVIDREPDNADGSPGEQFLYYNLITDPGGSQELNLQRCPVDFVGRDSAGNCSLASNVTGSIQEISAGGLTYSRRDPARGLIYVIDGSSVHVVEEQSGSQDVVYIGEIGPAVDGVVIDNWYGEAPVMDLGSDGSIYVLDSGHHRIHKLAPPGRDAGGDWVFGDYVGWAGRCTGSGNNACDDVNERSRGFSCTFEANSCTPTLAEYSVVNPDFYGPGQGQFDSPNYIAIDPNDVIYVADTGNNRIQRFTDDGGFAGEALADESGFSKNDRPSFVIGAMGPPASVSVNSSQFYVVDRAEQFVHVFGTLPFTDVTDDSATVTYFSDQDFPNPADIAVDTFTFSVSDGLEESDPATVEVTVSRDYRPPQALTGVEETPEDTGACFELPADDPDGILGKDFLGLDTLSYTVTMEPDNGTLTDNGCVIAGAAPGSTRYYEPDTDYYGSDRFAFRVNDGRDDSNVAMFNIDVLPVNDPPVVTLDVPDRVALGFASMMTTSFTDDPSTDYDASADWGDGQTSTLGGFEEDANGDPYIEGVAVSGPPDPSVEGRTFAEHVFTGIGDRTVEICVVDSDGEEACDAATISVEPLVVLGVGGIVYDENPLPENQSTLEQVVDGAGFAYEITAVNQRPQVGEGLIAESVRMQIRLPAGLDYTDFTIDRGGCVRDGLLVNCLLGDMNPDDSAVFTVNALSPGNLIYTQDFDVDVLLVTDTPALENEIESKLGVEVLADSNDGDGDGMSDRFEEAYGLDPTMDDAGLDPDGDGLTNLREYEIGSSPLVADTDRDGISDFDEDMLYGTDPASADSDDDGMPDPWEIEYGLDPVFEGDGITDADFDGRSNADEYAAGSDPLVDDIAPELAIPPDILTDSTGMLTDIDIGTATAVDGKDGVLTPIADPPGPFPPGPNRVTWSVTDEAGNSSSAVQKVDVVPLVNFAVDQTVPERFLAEATIELNGSAVEYPVTVPYSVSGTATNPQDHDAADGVLTIAEGNRATLTVAIVGDRVFEPDETIVLTMVDPLDNAVRGVNTAQTITISEPNVGPIVDITLWQQADAVTTVAADRGPVFVTADITDFADDSHVFDWSGSDPGVTDPADLADDSFQFDPSGLAEGVYRIRLVVSDDGAPVGISDVTTLVRVVDTLPALSSTDDADGDGIPDAEDGYGDSDGDRVAGLFDALGNSNVLQVVGDGRVLETETGLGLRLGATAFATAANDPYVLEERFAEDVDFGYPDEILDFEVTGLVSGGSGLLVMPLIAPVPEGAALRAYIDGGWQTFAADGLNRVRSAPGSGAACPPAGSGDYADGLIAGSNCVQLEVQDGGSNDGDRLTNSVFAGSLGLGVPVRAIVTAEPPPPATLVGAGEAAVTAFTLASDSGDAILSRITIRTAGSGDDRKVSAVRWLHDVNADGAIDAGDTELAVGRFEANNGELALHLQTPMELPVGVTAFLITYSFDR